jgi:hypothetical protein
MPPSSPTDPDTTGTGRYIHTGSVIGSNNRFDNSYRAINSNNAHGVPAPFYNDVNGGDTTGNTSPDEDNASVPEQNPTGMCESAKD